MRQAILITAYKDLSQLQRLVNYFNEDFEIFIHLDCHCQEDYTPFLQQTHINLYRRYPIEWGDYKHLLSIILLMREAYKHTDLQYFHLITGSDYPTMPLEKFKAYCEVHRNDNYLEHFPLPHPDWGNEGGLNRIQYWWLRPNSSRTKGAWLTRKLINLQRRLGIRRAFKYFNGNLYGGGTYWSLSRKAIGSVLDYIDKHPDYLSRFRHTSIAEEICLPTLLANSGLPLINDHKRYIDWGSDGANPQILTEKDYDKIVTTGAFFARKMESGRSEQLIKLLDIQ